VKLSPEEKEKRRQKWKEEQNLIKAGGDPNKHRHQERAKKALFLLKKDFDEGGTELKEEVRQALCAIVVEKCSKDLFFFSKYVLGFTLLTEQTHKRWADDLISAIAAGKKRLMRLKPRATYKTTLYGVGFVLWLWGVVSPRLRFFYTSANALLLTEVSDAINQYVGTEKNQTFFSFIFGITRDSASKNTTEVFNLIGREGKGFSLVFRTSGSSTVGIHPNIIIVDDPLSDEDRDSLAVRTQKERWLDTLNPLLVPFHDTRNGWEFASIFYIGTRWHLKDLVWYIVEKMNPRLPSDKKWDIESESIYKEGTAEPNYPELFSKEDIAAIRASMSEVFFSCQYGNDPLPEGLQVFDFDRLFFCLQEQIEPLVDSGQGRMLCVFDPSLGKTHSDYPAVWWAFYFNDTITMYDAIDSKTELSLLVHQIAARNKTYGCREMIYEDNGVTLVGNSLKDAHKRINWKIMITPVHHSSNKDERIISMQPDIYSGFVRFMEDYKVRYPEAMNQIIFYPAYGYDDFPDALEMAVSHFRQPRFQFKRYDELL
jgi:predicted phage terminase large subunit-like protein